MAVRYADCTRRQGLKREASETRCAQTADASLSVSVPGDASPSNGDSLQKPFKSNFNFNLRCAGRQRQLQLSLRAAPYASKCLRAKPRNTSTIGSSLRP